LINYFYLIDLDGQFINWYDFGYSSYEISIWTSNLLRELVK